tara:strand:- start:421 stop:747 length:327 start_codon:yes stop_codon:yes gene_type:complete
MNHKIPTDKNESIQKTACEKIIIRLSSRDLITATESLKLKKELKQLKVTENGNEVQEFADKLPIITSESSSVFYLKQMNNKISTIKAILQYFLVISILGALAMIIPLL